VEKTGVFIALHHNTKFPTLLPPRSTHQHQLLQGGPAQGTEGELIHREGTSFLEEIKHINHERAIIFEFGVEFVGAFPNLGSVAEGFQASCKIASSVSSDARFGPGRESGGKEERIGEPSVLEAKTVGTGNGGGRGDGEGHVIRCGTREGAERGVGEGEIPGLVE
jgi:hypothetical protein